MRNQAEKRELETLAGMVRKGANFEGLHPDKVAKLQEWAMDIKDIKLYDVLECYWRRNAAHEHNFKLIDCARRRVCECGEAEGI